MTKKNNENTIILLEKMARSSDPENNKTEYLIYSTVIYKVGVISNLVTR